ncbi:TPA: ead/Ea22-like family protein [Klebsiella aerogenes]|nr:ead/Ea22-like family protein [Klebsiella aerogenes]
MTDITELAQSLKAAAEKATPGQWMRSSVLFNSITNIANPMEQGNKPHVANTSEKRDAEFIALANPANILALVEALEKAQQQNISDFEIKASLCKESNNLHDRLREAEKRIAELESRTVAAELFTCPRCGRTTTHPEGWHYCHKREAD